MTFKIKIKNTTKYDGTLLVAGPASPDDLQTGSDFMQSILRRANRPKCLSNTPQYKNTKTLYIRLILNTGVDVLEYLGTQGGQDDLVNTIQQITWGPKCSVSCLSVTPTVEPDGRASLHVEATFSSPTSHDGRKWSGLVHAAAMNYSGALDMNRTRAFHNSK